MLSTPMKKYTANRILLFVIVFTLTRPYAKAALLEGAFIQPVDAAASGAARPASSTIDGSGWGESQPGSGQYTHKSSASQDGAAMWNAVGAKWIQFDLGQEYTVDGVYLWNYNEAGNWTSRGIRKATIEVSDNGKNWTNVGTYEFHRASGKDDYVGQQVPFDQQISGRYFKLNILSNHGNNETGISEIRFSNAKKKAHTGTVVWQPTYERPQHPHLKIGQPLQGQENITFPADMVVDVTLAPYSAKGDGSTDDTAAIQQAIDDHPSLGAIIYLPNGIYLVSDTLRWSGGPDMKGGRAAKNIILQGQSRRGTVIRLKDRAEGFQTPRKRRGVLWTGHAPAQRFGNEVRNLTIDTGVGNPGASGMQFMANNQGGVFDVTILSGDGQGVIGLDMAYSDEVGPLLVKNVNVLGFDTGLASAYSVASITMENVTVRQQNVIGFRNAGQAISVRRFKSINEVTAVVNNGGLLTLLDSRLQGTGSATKKTALRNSAHMLVRNLTVQGYQSALEDKTAGIVLKGPLVKEHRSQKPKNLISGTSTTLNLPIEETPEVPWDEVSTWAIPEQFGAIPGDNKDDSEAIQKAIDSGATMVFLSRQGYTIANTIHIRGKVRRIIGGRPWLRPIPPLSKSENPMFRFEDGDAPVVVIERIATDFTRGKFPFMEHASRRTLVMKNIMVNFHTRTHGAVGYRNDPVKGKGKLFIEDMVSSGFSFHNQQVWARQINPEPHGVKIQNDGGQLWLLGLKIENGGAALETINGGTSEVLGGLSQTNGGHHSPMFINRDSDVSLTFLEVNNSLDPYRQLVTEERNGRQDSWDTPDAKFRGARPVFYEGRLGED